MFIAPILQLILLGYAATTDVKNVPMVVADADRSTASRELVSRFDASPYFTVDDGRHQRERDRRRISRRGGAWMALVDPGRATAQQRGAGRPAAVQVVADGTDANSTNVALGYATNLVAGYAQELLAAQAAGRAPPARPERARARLVQPAAGEPVLHDPGRAALLLIVMTTMLSSMGIVREKELGHARAAERDAAPARGS